MNEKLQEIKKIAKDTIGKDSNFTTQDFISFAQQRYKSKVYSQLKDLYESENALSPDTITDISILSDGVINANYYVFRVCNPETLKNKNRSGAIVAFDDVNGTIQSIVILGDNLIDSCLGIFTDNGEELINKLNSTYFQASNKKTNNQIKREIID